MKPVELYARVRHACHVEGLSQREAARRFGIDPKTVAKMLRHAVPPGYRRSKPPARPKLDGFTAIIDQIVTADRSAPSKQRHTAKRIFERLRAEHGFAGSYTIVKDYLRERHARAQEMFVPLAHPPGHAQADFGEAVAVIGGVRQKIHFFCLDLPHSDAGFVKAYPAERIEAFLDGHNAAFAFLGGVPQSILYDNTKLAVGRILGDGKRQRTRTFAELQSHYLFLDRFGRPGKGNDLCAVRCSLIRSRYSPNAPGLHRKLHHGTEGRHGNHRRARQGLQGPDPAERASVHQQERGFGPGPRPKAWARATEAAIDRGLPDRARPRDVRCDPGCLPRHRPAPRSCGAPRPRAWACSSASWDR